MHNRRILIFSGGNLGPWALEEICENDYLVGVDRGALLLLQHNLTPDYALGDFDSVTEAELGRIAEQSIGFSSYDPVEKDFTDTELAFNWALEQEPREIILMGVLGTRADHSLANLHLLVKGLKAGIPCRIIDFNNEICLIQDKAEISQGRFRHVSLLPMTPTVKGITLEGFAYPLNEATLEMGDSIGISNIVKGEKGQIRLREGQLLVIKSID